MQPYFVNLNRQNDIGSNAYYLNFGNKGIVLDAGMHPKKDGYEATPHLDSLTRAPVDAIFISHAHHDHVGALPLLAQYAPEASIFMSDPTYFLADTLLHNSVNVMKRVREEADIPEYPLYSHQDVNAATKRWQACHLGERWSIEGFPSDRAEEISFKFHNAGHILGSIAIEIEARGLRILYTGDINLRQQTLLKPASLPDSDIDVLIIETTRGSQPTDRTKTRHQVSEDFLAAINATFSRGGCVMVPIFAMGKTQEILTLLFDAKNEGRIPDETHYIGGLGRNFSLIYDRQSGHSDRLRQNLHLLNDISPEVFDVKKAERTTPKRGQIYLLPSGMMTQYTTSNRFSQHFLPRDDCSIFFVGYTDPDSPAGKLRNTTRGNEVLVNKNLGPQPANCEVQHFDFTSHAWREDLLEYILKLSPKQCILVHGDPDATLWFEQQIKSKSPSIQVVIPPPKEPVPLSA